MSGNKTRILITGGLGNLGSWITDHFSLGGYEVTVLSKNDRKLTISHPFQKIFCDITDKSALKKSLDGMEFDYIIHLASLNETFLDDYASQALLINSYGTRNLLEVCEGKKIKKFIYMSTFHVYGKDGGEITEQDAVTPLNDYAITHYFAEEYIKLFSGRNGLPYIIFRLSNSYGCPKDVHSSKWYLLFNDLCRQAVLHKKIEIKTNGTALRDFIHMQDVSTAIEKVLEKENLENEVFNLGSGESLSLTEMADHIAAAYREVYAEDIEVKKNDNDKKVYPAVLRFNIGKIKEAIAFTPSFCYSDEAKKIFAFVVKSGAN
ncbi:MAG: SDR family oxidoreductase [Bacteroidota bacterium]